MCCKVFVVVVVLPVGLSLLVGCLLFRVYCSMAGLWCFFLFVVVVRYCGLLFLLLLFNGCCSCVLLIVCVACCAVRVDCRLLFVGV